MALTLPEAAKLSKDTLQRGVIETFARSSAVLEQLPFMDIQGNAYKYNVEATLPGVGFRSVNEAYTESVGVVNQASEGLVIAGGDLDVDRFILSTRNDVNDQRAIQTGMKVKSLALTWTDKFFNGDVAVDTKGFDGLKKRIAGNQVISAGTDGASLTIYMLDELIDAVAGTADVLYVSKVMRREIKKILQGNAAYTETAFDAFGKPVMSYGGIPIRVIEQNAAGTEILGFTETQGTATNSTGSIYAMKFGPEQYVSGLQNGGISVRDLGELDEKPVFRTRVEWYNGMAVFHPKAAARLKGIKKS